MTRPSVQVLIATYNRAHHLRNCLTALQRQKYKNFQVVVADDGSDDNSSDVAIEYDAAYIDQPHEGFRLAAVRNLGMLFYGPQDVNILIDSDILLGPDAVGRYVEMWTENPDRVIGGAYIKLPNMIITPEDVRHRWREVWAGALSPLRRDERTLRGGPDVRDAWLEQGRLGEDVFADESKTNPCPLLLLGGNMMIPGHIWTAVGGFDENFTSYGGEDAAFSLAVAEAGYPFSYSKRAGGAHQAHSANQNATWTKELECWAYLSKKYPRWWTEDDKPKWDKPGFVFPNERRI